MSSRVTVREPRDLQHHRQAGRFLDSADAALGMTWVVGASIARPWADVGIGPYSNLADLRNPLGTGFPDGPLVNCALRRVKDAAPYESM